MRGKLSVRCNVKHSFSVWLRTSYYPVDINRIDANTRKDIIKLPKVFNLIKERLYSRKFWYQCNLWSNIPHTPKFLLDNWYFTTNQ